MHAGLCQHATVCLMFKNSAYNLQLSRNVVLIFRGDDALFLAKYVVSIRHSFQEEKKALQVF